MYIYIYMYIFVQFFHITFCNILCTYQQELVDARAEITGDSNTENLNLQAETEMMGDSVG